MTGPHCFDDDDFDSFVPWFKERCTAEDTGILNRTNGHLVVFIFNCTNLEAPVPPPPSSTEAPAPVTPAPPADDSGLSAGAIAGIAVGAVLVVVAAGVVLL